MLIIEGDTRMARYLRANVEAHGYQAHTCECEEDAFKYIDREEPDLLLLDSSLSAMEGTASSLVCASTQARRYSCWGEALTPAHAPGSLMRAHGLHPTPVQY